MVSILNWVVCLILIAGLPLALMQRRDHPSPAYWRAAPGFRAELFSLMFVQRRFVNIFAQPPVGIHPLVGCGITRDCRRAIRLRIGPAG